MAYLNPIKLSLLWNETFKFLIRAFFSVILGNNCEINIDDCNSNPCVNNGTCQDLIKDYQCLCYSGYTGTYFYVRKLMDMYFLPHIV